MRSIRLGTYFAPSLLELWDAIDIADAKDLQTGCWEYDEHYKLAQYLASKRPYSVPFEAVECSWCSPEVLEELTKSQQGKGPLLQAFNGCIVALNTSNDECLGLGIVRSIDWSESVFYILTPVDESILPQVTKLIGGQIPLSAPFLFRGPHAESFPHMTMHRKTIASSGVGSDGSNHDAAVTALGTEPMKSRNTIARRSLMRDNRSSAE